MTTNNKFAKESMRNPNASIPTNLKPESVVTDDLLNSSGLYSKSEINEAKFSKFSKFGRVLDPYGKVNQGREYLFFVKPDLHICWTGDEYVYSMTGFSKADALNINGLRMNPQLTGNPYFKDLITTHPDVVRELQYSLTPDEPFGHLLSFSTSSSLNLGDVTIETLDNNPATTFGTSYKYLRDSEPSDENYSFSLEFVDDKKLNTYHFFKAYSEYQIARKTGLITPPSVDYYRYRRLHNTMGVYKFIVAEDMETIIYWAYLWGVYPTSCPREAFSDANWTDGLSYSVSFDAAFIEDMNPVILYQFNGLMQNVLRKYSLNRNDWIPTLKQNFIRDNPVKGAGSHSYKSNLFDQGTKTILGKEYEIGPSEIINGTLPVAAMVDDRQVGEEAEKKYRLRWYAPKTISNISR